VIKVSCSKLRYLIPRIQHGVHWFGKFRRGTTPVVNGLDSTPTRTE